VDSEPNGNGAQANKGNGPPKKPALIRVIRTIKRQLHRYQRHRKRRTDHQINERMMARWTRRLGYFTLALTIIGGITGWILWRTDQTSRDINRAFLSSYEVKISKITDEGGEPSWELSPLLENAGNTSAIDVRTRLIRVYNSPIWQMRKINIVGGLDPDESELEFDGLPAESLSLAPHSKMTLGTVVITDQAREMIRLKTLSAYLFGEAEYFDVFHRWHRTKFCHRLTGGTTAVTDDDIGESSNIGAFWNFVPGRLEVVKNRLGYRLCRRNNCVDEQCGERPNRPERAHPNIDVIATYPPPKEPQHPGALMDVKPVK
jgi:hypothetical protein